VQPLCNRHFLEISNSCTVYRAFWDVVLLSSHFWPMLAMSTGVINCVKQFLSNPLSRIKWFDKWAVDRDPVLTSTSSAKIGKTAIDAVNSTPFSDLDFQLSSFPRRLAYELGFPSRRNSQSGNVCGTLDGIAVEQEQPLETDVPCVVDYYSRKVFYALNTQAICDSEYKFRWMACTTPGALHDSTAFSGTFLDMKSTQPHHRQNYVHPEREEIPFRPLLRHGA